MTNLIIDGHGTELPGGTFNFQRAASDACTLYSCWRKEVAAGETPSGNVIRKIIKGNFAAEISTCNASLTGGAPVRDHLLGAIRMTPQHMPEWNNDTLFSAGIRTKKNVNGVTMYQIRQGDTIYLRLPVGTHETVKLSDIINAYPTGQYTIFWCARR